MSNNNEKLKISYKEQVKPRHKERIKKIISKTSLPSLSLNWTATESDGIKDRVYLFNHTDKKEYSIAFSDTNDGYNYYIYKRTPMTDAEFELVAKHRPELIAHGRENLASITEVERGFQKTFIYKKENSFEKIIKEKEFNLSEDDGDILLLKISTPGNICNHLVTILPRLRQAIVIERIGLNNLNDILGKLYALFSLMQEVSENPQAIEVETNEPDTLLDDTLDFLNKKGFKFSIGKDNIFINE